jgi:hypothetical protein
MPLMVVRCHALAAASRNVLLHDEEEKDGQTRGNADWQSGPGAIAGPGRRIGIEEVYFLKGILAASPAATLPDAGSVEGAMEMFLVCILHI